MSDENLIKQFMTAAKCEVCGHSYEEEHISILGHDDDMWVFEVCCGSCHSQSLLAGIPDEDINPVAFDKLTDLTEQEIQLFEDVVITADDMLDMQIFLKSYDDDISQIL